MVGIFILFKENENVDYLYVGILYRMVNSRVDVLNFLRYKNYVNK